MAVYTKPNYWITVGLTALLAVTLVMPGAAAVLPSNTGYTYTVDAKAVPDRIIYEANSSVTGKQTGTENFSLPEDLFVYDGRVYIADTGNDRIVVLDNKLHFLYEIVDLDNGGEWDSLSGPTGLFVGPAGILVCDKGNERVILLNEKGAILQSYLKPENETLANTSYRPTKAVMDDYGNVYVVSSGIYQGLLQFSLDGRFLNFFGSNVIENSLSVQLSRFWKKFFNKEASETMSRDIPMEYNNVYIDADGFLYASIYQTASGSNNLKKLNARGKNILTHMQDDSTLDRNRYGDQQTYVYKGIVWNTTLVDVTVDDEGIISVLDSTWGRIFQYTQDGDLLGEFGGIGTTLGTFSSPSALENLNGDILVLDKLRGTITVFSPTAYRKLLGQALTYYTEGDYQASIDLWRQVIKYNSNMPLAYKSIGKAYMQQECPEEALINLHMAGDRESYSLVYGQMRQAFFQRNIVWILLAASALMVGCRYARRGLHYWIWHAQKADGQKER